ARTQPGHTERFLRRFSRGRKSRGVFLLKRQIISRAGEAEHARQLRFGDAVAVEELAGNEHNRGGAVGDLRTIGDFQWRRDARIVVRYLVQTIVGPTVIAHLREW